jgi:predicted nucleic acid-binding protein
MLNKEISLFFDTSIFGGYYDDIFSQDTRLLFEKVKQGEYEVFVSDLVIDELEEAPQKVRELFKSINATILGIDEKIKSLADEYINEKVVGKTSWEDCVHIATATINKIDYLVSWNYKHIVNVKRIENYNSINIKNGYKYLEIHSPKEMGLYE